jgi:hypothetical protein
LQRLGEACHLADGEWAERRIALEVILGREAVTRAEIVINIAVQLIRLEGASSAPDDRVVELVRGFRQSAI